MDLDEPDPDRISADALGITEQRWAAIMELLAKEGYLDGMTVKRSADGHVAIFCASPGITLKGLEYLQENSLMRKAANLAKGIAEVL